MRGVGVSSHNKAWFQIWPFYLHSTQFTKVSLHKRRSICMYYHMTNLDFKSITLCNFELCNIFWGHLITQLKVLLYLYSTQFTKVTLHKAVRKEGPSLCVYYLELILPCWPILEPDLYDDDPPFVDSYQKLATLFYGRLSAPPSPIQAPV